MDTVIEQVSKQTLETILQLSTEQLAGVRTPGRASGEIRWHGRQAGRVSLADWQVVKTDGRLIKHARYCWLLLAESHLPRQLFGSMARRIGALLLPAG